MGDLLLALLSVFFIGLVLVERHHDAVVSQSDLYVEHDVCDQRVEDVEPLGGQRRTNATSGFIRGKTHENVDDVDDVEAKTKPAHLGESLTVRRTFPSLASV